MKCESFVGHLRILGGHPIAAGVVVRFLTGLMGLFAIATLWEGNPLGGLVGAIGCGITVAYLSEERLFTIIVYAAIADVLSSIVFFCLVLVTYLMMVALTEGLAFISAVWFAMWYVVLGGMVAVIVGSISLVITGISATVTTLVTRQKRYSGE
ncbi:hypothetical protein ACFOZ7_12300 [Natribaculum luteum]|uniref:Uncharacterized protein n=1 Tax=Natribaculum luteum TaxID=1586232 RepID=A0ABD5P0B9_9EURY|nr:hypothetical protein [Natribaculum luteum]